MKALILIVLLFSSLNLFAHRGEFVSIEHVEVSQLDGDVVFNFDLENIKGKELRDVSIHLVVNNVMMDKIWIMSVSSNVKFTSLRLAASMGNIALESDKIQIEIVKLFGNKYDWGGWDNPVASRQVNTLFSEFYADAPWRMKKTDVNGNIVGIPIHCFLHDADLDPIQDVEIDNINIQIKNASDASFGPVLTYSTMATNDFEALFSCPSPDDANLDIREFNFNSFTPTSSQTFDFDIDSDIFNDFLSVSEKYWYFTFTIPPSDLIGFNNIIDILVTIEYANLTFSDDKVGLRVFRTEDYIPTLSDFYRGDTHLHSMYTQSQAEIGLPMCATKEAAYLMGQDWITTTDHTSDFDNYGLSIQANWQRIQDEAVALNAADSSMIYIAGLEVALNNSDAKLVHMLSYPNPAQPTSMPYLGDGNGDLFATSAIIDGILDSMETFGGFAYMSHPFATGDVLPTVPVNGGIWNLGQVDFPTNGSFFPIDGGTIICNDTTLISDVLSSNSTEFIKEGIKGGQIWNARYNLIATGDELDPWDVQGNTTPFAQMDTSSTEFHFRRFRQGQEIMNHLNQLGLAQKNNNSGVSNWKLFYSAGTDAHGSFNTSNTDDFAAVGKITNNAVGKLSTLAYCPNGMGANGENVLIALKNGNTTMSDGPIIAIGISNDGPNVSNEIIMGEDVVLGALSPESIFLNIDYTTTSEFGDVTEIDLYVGTNDNIGITFVGYDILVDEQYAIAMGYQAKVYGQGTIGIGAGLNYANNNTDYTIGMGFDGYATNTLNSVAIGRSHYFSTADQSVGIGAYDTITADYGMAIGYKAATSASYSSSFGYESKVSAENSLAFGSYATVDQIQSISIGSGSSVSGVNSIAIGYGTTVTAGNEVYIGNNATTTIGGAVNWTATSDGRFKTNVESNVPGLDFIMALKAVTYKFDLIKLNEFNNSNGMATEHKADIVYSGFIAQDVLKTANDLGYDFSGVKVPENEETQLYGLRYAEFVVPLVQATQELNKKVNELQHQVDTQNQFVQTAQELDEKVKDLQHQLDAQNQLIAAQHELIEKYNLTLLKNEQEMAKLKGDFIQLEDKVESQSSLEASSEVNK